MPVIDFNTIKQTFVNAKRAGFIKILIGALSLVSLLTLSVFLHLGPDADQSSKEPSLPEETAIDESLLFNPQTPDSVPSVSSMVYIKPDKVANVGKPLTFTIAADDVDGDTLLYSASNLPDGATFDSDTQTFSWTPRYDQAGVYSVRFEVSDGEFTDSEDVTITVTQLYDDWDVNGDGKANVLDMVLVGQCWGETGLTGWILEDTNEDGNVDVLDIIVIGQHWTG
jgi:hypothetical protein